MKDMVSYTDIQNSYNKLYAEIRKYVWDFSTVAALADLEIEVYKTCQNIPEIRSRLSRLRSQINDIVYTDEDLKKRLDYFESLLADDNVYIKLNQVNEVIQK